MPSKPETSNNLEIEKALEEFETLNKEPAQKTEAFLKNYPVSIPVSKMTKFIMKWSGGCVRNQRQANNLLLSFVVIAVCISIYLMFGVVAGNKSKEEYSLPAGQFIAK